MAMRIADKVRDVTRVISGRFIYFCLIKLMKNPYEQIELEAVKKEEPADTSFFDYYSYYLTEHIDSKNRILHHFASLVLVYYFVLAVEHFSIAYLLFSVISNFAINAAGHFLFEKDVKSHTCCYKFSIVAEFLMFYHAVTGKLNNKIVEACAKKNAVLQMQGAKDFLGKFIA